MWQLLFSIFAGFSALAAAGPATESYKGQYCTDPRTMLKHPAYTEWADAYSCTRHRCQPGGRNLAIYTVGCKRVEAPESAIECEEVVEDTNMQFPFCCTRLRCLVVVRGEVWTRVLGQPWESLPAAPWSHMYKMKRPPPGSGQAEMALSNPAVPKPGEGPVYELAKPEESDTEKFKASPRARSKKSDGADCNTNNNNNMNSEVAPRAAPAPDIVIALTTNSEDAKEPRKRSEEPKHFWRKHAHKQASPNPPEEEAADLPNEELEEPHTQMRAEKEKPAERIEPISEEKEKESSRYADNYGGNQKAQNHHQTWTEMPQSQWVGNEIETASEPEPAQPVQEPEPHQAAPTEEEKADAKTGNLQALVDAIGSRMRDIEDVVRHMSETPQEPADGAGEATRADGAEAKSQPSEPEPLPSPHKHHSKAKKPSPDGDEYRRFPTRGHSHASKYLQSNTDGTTEQPLYVEDSHLGYFSDASNTVLRRAPKEPPSTYMAPVESRRRAHLTMSEGSEEEKKKKKHSHKRKKTRSHHKKHHSKDDKRKRFNRVGSMEFEKNALSLEENNSNGNNGNQ